MIKITLDDVFNNENIENAIENLLKKNNSCGIDGLLLHDIEKYWELNGESIIRDIKNHNYKPSVVKIKELIQANGKKRNIALMCSIDRFILRCMMQLIQPTFEKIFSVNCFAFREKRGVHPAVRQVMKYISNGCEWVAEIDIKAYFDSIPHENMIKIIDEYFEDEDLSYLLKSYLCISVESDFEIKQLNKGILQGSPISPLLSNLYLSALDKDLENKGYAFVRYCDNINIYTKSYEDAINKLNYVKKQLDKKYALEINTQKTGAYSALGRVFLGQVIERSDNNGRLYAHRKRKKTHQIFGNWYKTAIQKVDRNYHLINDGILTKKDFSILFENDEGKTFLPVETVDSISIYSNIILSGDFLKFIGEKKININIFDRKGYYLGEYISQSMRGSAKTLIKQVECYVDRERRIALAKTIIMAATHNMRAVLRYYKKHRSDVIFVDKEKILTSCIKEMNEAKSIEDLMMVEARARQHYYQVFDVIIENTDFHFIQRSKRPPKNEVNSMISFGNTIIYNRIASEIYKTRLDIRISYLHSSNSRSESLNLDIAEIFKPIIVDRAIFMAINKGIVDLEQHFEYMSDKDGVYLNKEGRDVFLRILENKLYQKIEVNGEKISYNTLMRREIQKIQAYIEKDEKYKAYKYY